MREPQHFGAIIIVGGGCYGSYYVRQLARAHAAGAAIWAELIVVDHDPRCRVANLPDDERPPGLRVEVSTWAAFFAKYLGERAAQIGESADAVVPSPLMPHLFADWIGARARDRWPNRAVEIAPLASTPDVPWQRAAGDTHYVSFAEWMCPINCIEPAKCPATKGPRSWSMPTAIAAYAEQERDAGRRVDGEFTFHCSHRTHGVGMIDVREIIAADRTVAERGATGTAEFVIATASHCHGALRRIIVRD
ncbi:MAG: hypothetical protein V4550_17020 [Gemmatimonadota bacterium]